MSFEPCTFVTFGWNHLISQLGRVVQYETDLQMSQAKELNQVMAKTTTVASYSGSTQGILQFLQTWETKTFLNGHFKLQLKA